VRALVEGAGLSYREAAARSGLREDTIGRWARRFGWRRASVACEAGRGGAANACNPQRRHAEPAQRASRSTHDGRASFETQPHPNRLLPIWASDQTHLGNSRDARAPQDDEGGSFRSDDEARGTRPFRYGPEVVEAARVRVEGSRDGLERIAIELGIARWTLARWKKRFGWRRPAAAACPGRARPEFYRSRRLGRPYGGDAAGTARDLLARSNLPAARIAAQAGISRATLYRWMKRPGWTLREPAPGARRYRPPYGPDIVGAARELFQTTELPVAFIAARVKATPERIGHWARRHGWTRPRAQPDPHGRIRKGRRRRARDGAW